MAYTTRAATTYIVPVLPEGEYLATIRRIELMPGPFSPVQVPPYLSIELSIIAGPFSGRRLDDRLHVGGGGEYISAAMLRQLSARIAHAAGVTGPVSSVEEFYGKPMLVRVRAPIGLAKTGAVEAYSPPIEEQPSQPAEEGEGLVAQIVYYDRFMPPMSPNPGGHPRLRHHYSSRFCAALARKGDVDAAEAIAQYNAGAAAFEPGRAPEPRSARMAAWLAGHDDAADYERGAAAFRPGQTAAVKLPPEIDRMAWGAGYNDAADEEAERRRRADMQPIACLSA
jgi:hypothetical protein